MKSIRIIIITILLLTTGCGLSRSYYSYPSSIYNPTINYSPFSTGLFSGTVMTPEGMYMINGLNGPSISSGSIIGPHGEMTTFQFMK